jgi:sulfatase maturation enzyme AslB (radical SAM superfamily)
MTSTSCSYLWRRLTFSGDGTLRPCCRFQAGSYPLIDANGTDMLQNFNGEYFRGIRRAMLEGRKVSGCEKCYQQESSGTMSLRQVANRDTPAPSILAESVAPSQITSLEVFLGRECNLKCRMCGPVLSSKWHEDAKALGFDLDKMKPDDTDQVERIRPVVAGLTDIKLLGGEPMLTPSHARIMDLLMSEGRPERMRLEYATNVTIFPSDKLLEQWERFDQIQLGLSIDGVGDVNTLVRYPAKWDVIEKNARRYLELARDRKNVRVFLAATAGAYNYHDIPRLLEWWNDLKPQGAGERAFEGISPTVQPEFLSAQIFPLSYKRDLAAKFASTIGANYRGLTDFMMAADRSDLLPLFKSYARDLDRLRKQDTLAMIPELAPLFS